MNRLIKFSTFIFTLLTAFVSSVNAAQGNTGKSSTHPNFHQINARFKTQLKLVQDGLKTGKLTKDQVNSLKANLKAARQQEITYYHQNGNHELTSDQQTQVNQLLNQNSQPLGETPVQ